MLALCAGALSVVSCGDESSDDDKNKEDKTAMTPCDCAKAQSEMMSRAEAGEDVKALDEEFMAQKEACFETRKEMGKEEFEAAMAECE